LHPQERIEDSNKMKDYQFEYYGYMGSLIGCYAAMPQSEKDELHAWEKEHVDGSGRFATSDWPGWEKYIGKRPELRKDLIDCFGYVYLMKSGDDKYKIGIAKNLTLRLAQLQTGNPEILQLIHSFPSSNAKDSETRLHNKYAEYRVRNEWFLLPETCVIEIRQIMRDSVTNSNSNNRVHSDALKGGA